MMIKRKLGRNDIKTEWPEKYCMSNTQKIFGRFSKAYITR